MRRLLKILLARKRGDGRYWRQLYLREKRAWERERLDLLNRLLLKNSVAPILQEERRAAPPERELTDDEQEMAAIEAHGHVLARSAALDDFEFEKLQYMAQSDPIYRPVAEEARRLRETPSVS